MGTHEGPRSFAPDGSVTVTLAAGQRAHVAHAEHSTLLARRFYTVRPGVWCLVGNGLSNQTFVEGPGGVVAIDTGESVEEMADALAELRTVTDRPVVAVLYTHFHYVGGTRAILDAQAGRAVTVYGHERIEANRIRAGSEIAPTYRRGIVAQFGVQLPADGPDGLVHAGLGRFFRNPAHAPFTPGYVTATQTFADACELDVAGLRVRVTPAPSDADDSVTYWFGELGVAVNNLVWPALFNVFAIRGEEYRDPRVMLTGLDHLLSLRADHLVGAHGPPLSGADEVLARVTRYRDAIQFLWDQTVRHANRGLTSSEIGHAVRLPDCYADDYLTSERYGAAEHHARQIRAGLFGFFDGDEANLFPLTTSERAVRLVAGFGGRDEVRRQVVAAIEADDLRWATELGSWLVRGDEAGDEDRALLAAALRRIAERTPAANIRNWCLTRARQLDGQLDPGRSFTHRFTRGQLLAQPSERAVHVLRVLLDPERADGVDVRLAWSFTDGTTAGLHIRNSIACPTDGGGADVVLSCAAAVWVDVLAGGCTLSEAVASGALRIDGDAARARRALSCFEVEGLRS